MPRVTARAIPLYENGVVKIAVPIINTNKFYSHVGFTINAIGENNVVAELHHWYIFGKELLRDLSYQYNGGGHGSKSLGINYSLNYETSKQYFYYSGDIDTFYIPNNINQITVYIWGAGGAGSADALTRYTYNGGGGGFIKIKLS